jgi:hypothetical protein
VKEENLIMAKKKIVGFNFFKPIIKQANGNMRFFDFGPIFERIRNQYLEAREMIEQGNGPDEYKLIYSYNNEPARLSDISIDYDTQYFHLVFERLDYQVPFRTTLHGESEVIDLEDDEYIGLDVNVLYDPENYIFMIQRNRNSLGPSGIEMFLNTIIQRYVGDLDGEFSLPIIKDNTARRRAFDQSAYRKIHLKVYGEKAKGIIERLYRARDIDVDSVEISFNSSSSRDSKIDDNFARQILEEYIDDDDVKKLQIRAREEENGVVEPIDLIDHKLQTFHEFDFRENRQLHPITVFEIMKDKFDNGGFRRRILRM